MLENIHIQNFRCFEDFKMEGFERINLIGGKNNSGKTCLLEAIAAVAINFTLNELMFQKKLGNKDYKNIKNLHEYTAITPGFTDVEKIVNQAFLENVEEFEIGFCDGSEFGSHNIIEVNLISQAFDIPKIDTIASFDEFDEKAVKHRIMEILQSIDNRIEDIRTFKSKEGLWIKKFHEDYQPINFYGDATIKIIKFFTPFFAKSLQKTNIEKPTILLIDEIENGLHYTAHEEFWQHIFKLSKELNVQVFATTHSLEMIKAFNAIAKKEGEGAYFELSREYDTQNIFAFKHDTDLLTYELSKEDTTIRG